MQKFFAILLSIVMTVMILPMVIYADMGPKPSVNFKLEDLGDELCYATLLSKYRSTGPYSAWSGEDEDALHDGNPYEPYVTLPYDVWKAFVDFAEHDEFFFLQCVWQVNETKEFSWTYYPPREFKLLLYFPHTGEYAISNICERYAFDSYFTARMTGSKVFLDYNEELSTNDRINVYNSYQIGTEIFSLVARIFLTILVEMLIALFWGFRKKKQILLLVSVNTATQIVLNVLLNAINYNLGELAFVFFYILFELVVFAMEAILYCVVMKKISEKPKKNWFYVLYAFLANAASFGAGLLVAQMLPGIF